jgi:peptidoglycan/xylan/chitin deacetylase (PgdA/CDA1 family)
MRRFLLVTALVAAACNAAPSGNPGNPGNPGDASADGSTVSTPGRNSDAAAGPTIVSLSNNVGRSGDAITIHGTTFGSAAGEVAFGSVTAQVTSWSATAIEVTIPRHDVADVELSVTTKDGVKSNTKPFTIFDAMHGTSGPGAATTFVSLTFDDTFADQYGIRALLKSKGVKATFYVNSSRIGPVTPVQPDFMTLDQVLALQSDGHEIGGHTLHHFDLTTVGDDEVKRQVCDDRTRLLGMGLAIESFAYPLGMTTDGIQAIAAACGYRSARITEHSGLGWPVAVPPPNKLAVPAAPSMRATTTLAQMQAMVTEVESAGGGWVPLTFHRICDDACASNAVSPAVLEALMDWLVAREASGTVTRRMRDLIGGGVAPAPLAAPAPPVRTGNLAPNPSFELHTYDALSPDCWVLGVPGGSLASWSVVPDAHDGATAIHLSPGAPTANDRRLNTRQDAGECARRVVAGETYKVSAWYKSDQPLRFASYVRETSGFWKHSVLSGQYPASASWARAEWTLPVIAAGVEALGFGVAFETDGTMTVDDVSLERIQ